MGLHTLLAVKWVIFLVFGSVTDDGRIVRDITKT